MGISTKHEYGLVYKNVGRECGIYRSYNQSEAPDFYVGHLLVDKHAHKCKYTIYRLYLRILMNPI